MHEDILCTFFLPTNTTAAELFKSLNDSISGELKEVSSECESIHCVIHEEMVNHIKVYAHNSCLLMQLCEEMNSEYTHLLLYKEVRWLSKGRSLARVFWVMRATPEISFRITVTSGSTFQWHRMGHKTCWLVGHSQRTQSVTSGENNNCVQVGSWRGCIQSQTGIMRVMSEHWDF